MYDDTCRFLAENFSADFASWLLAKPVTLTEIQPSELSLDPIRADALILLRVWLNSAEQSPTPLSLTIPELGVKVA